MGPVPLYFPDKAGISRDPVESGFCGQCVLLQPGKHLCSFRMTEDYKETWLSGLLQVSTDFESGFSCLARAIFFFLLLSLHLLFPFYLAAADIF